MRSASSITSGMLWLMSTTAMPESRTRRIRSRTCADWTTPRAAVGSSMNTTLLTQVAARLTATLWRWPPDRLATMAPVSWSPTPRSAKALLVRRRMAALSRNPSLPSGPGRTSSRPRNRLAAGSSSGASARSWYTVSMPSSRAATGFGMATWRPSNRISPPSGARVPDRILTSVLLPAPLSPTRAATSPGWTAKSTPRSARTPPKLFVMPLASSSGSLTAGSSLARPGPTPAARRSLRSGRRRCRPAARPGDRLDMGAQLGRPLGHRLQGRPPHQRGAGVGADPLERRPVAEHVPHGQAAAAGRDGRRGPVELLAGPVVADPEQAEEPPQGEPGPGGPEQGLAAGQDMPADGDVGGDQPADVAGGDRGRDRPDERLGGAAGVEQVAGPGGAGPDRGAEVVVAGHGEGRPGQAGELAAAGPAGRAARLDQLGQQPRGRLGPCPGLLPPGPPLQVEQAGPGGQRQLGHLPAAQAVDHPFGDPEPAHGAGDLRVVGPEPGVLGDRPQRADRQPGAGRVALGPQVGAEAGRLGLAPGVVPGDRRGQRPALAVQEHAGLGHAVYADAGHRAAGGVLQGGRGRGHRRLQQPLRGQLGPGGHDRPGGAGRAVGDLGPVGGADHRRLAQGGADVDADQQLLAAHGPLPASGPGGRQRTASSRPRTAPAPAAKGTSTVSPRPSSRAPPVVSSRPDPSVTTRIEKAASREAAGSGRSRSARKKGSASAGNSRSAPGRAGPRPPRSRPSRSSLQRPRSTQPRARSKPSPRWPSARPSMAKPSHSSSTEKSVGSWSSTSRTPWPMAWGMPAGTSTVSPTATGTALRPASSSSVRWAWTRPASRPGSMSSRKPRCTTGSGGSVPTTTQASVLPQGQSRWRRAKSRSGWQWTGRRSPACSSLTSSAGSSP